MLIVHNLVDSVELKMQIYYQSMMSTGKPTRKIFTLPQPNKRNMLQNIYTSIRELKVSDEIWGYTLSILGINNTYVSTFTLDQDINHKDIVASYLPKTSFVGY